MPHLPLSSARLALCALVALALGVPAGGAFAVPLPSGLEDACSFTGCQVTYWDQAQGGNGHYYAFVPSEATQSWNAANTAALGSTLGAGSVGHLATLSTASENAFVVGNVLPNAYTHKRQVWLGGFQNETTPKSLAPTEGWQHATPFNVEPEYWDYSNWAPGEANDGNDLHTGDERFLTMWVVYYLNAVNYRGRWNDEQSVGGTVAPIVGMLLEWEGHTVPEPASALLVGLGAGALALRRRLARR